MQSRPRIRPSFFKAHGHGNDYLVFRADGGPTLTPQLARRICDRNRGPGADGIVVVEPDSDADAKLRIFNADGSEAERSGNGVRIAALFLYGSGDADGEWTTLSAGGGIVRARIREAAGEGAWDALAEMGRVSFPTAPPFVAPGSTDRDGEVALDLPDPPGQPGQREPIRVTPVSVGNPHAVAFGRGWTDEEVEHYGPLIERCHAFPQGANVQFAEVAQGGDLLVHSWERGVGRTASSGTSACAAAAAAVKRGVVRAAKVTVRMAGGTLRVELAPDWRARLDGPIEEVCFGDLAPGFLRASSGGASALDLGAPRGQPRAATERRSPP